MHLRFLTLFSLLALLAGCFFETRDPPPPVLGGGCEFDYVFNNSYEAVLYNLEGALGCADAAQYMSMIAQDFLYVPTPSLAASYPQIFGPPWDNSRENIFITNTFSSARFLADLDVEVTSFEDLGDIIRITSLYEIQEVDSDGTPTGPLYTDFAVFEFLRRGLFVELGLWQDTDSAPQALPFGERRADQGGGI